MCKFARQQQFIEDDIDDIVNDKVIQGLVNEVKGKTFFITGANSGVVSLFVKTIIKLGAKAIITSRDLEKTKEIYGDYFDKLLVENIDLTAKLNSVNILDKYKKIDYIFNGASISSTSQDPKIANNILVNNILVMKNILEFTKQVKPMSFFHISSNAVYEPIEVKGDELIYGCKSKSSYNKECESSNKRTDENIEQKVQECIGGHARYTEDMFAIQNPKEYKTYYALSKSTQEAMLWEMSKDLKNTKFKCARPPHMLGPNMHTGLFPMMMMMNLLENKDIVIKGDGTLKRELLYFSDVIKAFLLIIFYGENREAYNIGYKDQISIKKGAELLIDLGFKKRIRKTKLIIENNQEIIKNSVSSMPLNSSKLEILGWNPNYSVETAIERTFSYFQI